MKNKHYFLLILLIPFVFSQSQTTQEKVEEKKDVLTSLLTDTKHKQEDIKDKLESIEVVLPQKKSKVQTRTEIRRYVRTVYQIVRDTVYLPCDTLTVYTVPSPRYGGDSVQKAQWKQNADEGKFFKNWFKWIR